MSHNSIQPFLRTHVMPIKVLAHIGTDCPFIFRTRYRIDLFFSAAIYFLGLRRFTSEADVNVNISASWSISH